MKENKTLDSQLVIYMSLTLTYLKSDLKIPPVASVF